MSSQFIQIEPVAYKCKIIGSVCCEKFMHRSFVKQSITNTFPVKHKNYLCEIWLPAVRKELIWDFLIHLLISVFSAIRLHKFINNKSSVNKNSRYRMMCFLCLRQQQRKSTFLITTSEVLMFVNECVCWKNFAYRRQNERK